MQAIIEIQIQRNQVTGKLNFNPARNTGTPEHALVTKAFDRLVIDLQDLLKEPNITLTPTPPVDNAYVAEKFSEPDQAPADPVYQIPSVFSGQVTSPVNDPVNLSVTTVPEAKSEAPRLPVGGGSSAAVSRLEAAKKADKIKETPAISAQASASLAPDPLVRSVDLTGK